MNTLLYYFASGVILLIRALPIDVVARLARFGGWLFYCLDARHRKVAIRNMTMCFPEKSPAEIRALAKENFRRIGENFVCPIKMIYMSEAQRKERAVFPNAEVLLENEKAAERRNIIFAIGHFGNFELLGHVGSLLTSHHPATTYRAIRNPAANRILMKLRDQTGCRYFERRTEGSALRAALRENNLILGLLSDQHSGDSGLRLPFLGHDCNTSKAPAVFAIRFNAPLYVGICYRTKLAHWRAEISAKIETHENGQPRSPSDIMLDVNRVFEAAVRRDPANWFWVHNRWKKSKLKPRETKPEADSVEADDPKISPTPAVAPTSGEIKPG
jgi:lauroyl/myristoyl acyltransferase